MSTPDRDLLGTVRRSPDGASLAILWPSPPHPARWMTTDMWGSTGYETDATVATWPVVGAVPYSPAAGMDLAQPEPRGPAHPLPVTDYSPAAWSALGVALRRDREIRSLSRRQLAESAGVSEKSIQLAEEGRVPKGRWPQSITPIAIALRWPPETVRAVLDEAQAKEDAR